MYRRLKQKIAKAHRHFPIIRIWHTRKTRLYCVGTAKSGTNSIAAIFADHLRSAHEAEDHRVIDFILKAASGEISDGEVRDYMQRRDRRLRLEIDSSQLNYFLMDHLIELYPDAKFILTIRNPYAWVDSFINHQLGRNASDEWWQLRDFRFRPNKFEHAPEEKVLQERNLYTLDGYLSYWSRHNDKVLSTVPDDRLLVVRTEEITDRSKEIAEFAGVLSSAANRSRSHANKAKDKYNVLDEIDRKYLVNKVEEHCGTLMRAYFPGIQRPKDGLPSLSDSKSIQW